MVLTEQSGHRKFGMASLMASGDLCFFLSD